MKIRSFLVGSLVIGLLSVFSGQAFAHDSWSGYDMSNLTTVKGTVAEFDWGNLHIWVHFDVHDDKGVTENWSAGGPSPNRLANTGWDKNTLKPGDEITFVGNRIKDGGYSVKLDKIVLPDGLEMLRSRRR